MPRRESTVGAFVVLVATVLAVAVMAVGGESSLFARKTAYRAVFPSADGILPGSPVRMAGFQIGQVTAVRLSTDPGASGIEVTFGIEDGYAPRVREGSRIELKYLQWLSGEKYLDLAPGEPDRERIPPGGRVPTAQKPEIMEQGQDIADNLARITVSLREILEPLQRGEGIVGQAIRDPEFGKEGLEATRRALENIEAITASIRSGRGMAGRLVSDPELGRGLDDLRIALREIAEVSAAIGRREGALGDLLAADGRSSATLEDLREAAASFRGVASRLESHEGLLGRLLHDEAWSEGLAADLRSAVRDVASIARKIDEGQGTLGLLVNERVLHDGLEEVVAGVGDSKFARWLMRHYQKQGIEAESAPPADAKDPR